MTTCNACTATVSDDLICGRDYNTGGDTICLACHAECCPEDSERCKAKAEAWVRGTSDDDADDDSATVAFRLIYGREPDTQDRKEGVWSHCCVICAAD